LYFSRNAPTTGNFGDDLMKAGRMDIALQVVIAAFFLSNRTRDNVRLHLVFAGSPDPQKHLELNPIVNGEQGVQISKKDVAGLIKRMLYKGKPGQRIEAFPGYFVEKKSVLKVLEEMAENGKDIYVLDPKGENIRDIEIKENPVFVLGDQKGIPHKELRRLKKEFIPVSIGKKEYFASQTVVVVNHELDLREEKGSVF